MQNVAEWVCGGMFATPSIVMVVVLDHSPALPCDASAAAGNRAAITAIHAMGLRILESSFGRVRLCHGIGRRWKRRAMMRA
jgi:hypothetical protein